MHTVFPIAPVLPDDFLYYPDFISAEEETELIYLIKGVPLLKQFLAQGLKPI